MASGTTRSAAGTSLSSRERTHHAAEAVTRISAAPTTPMRRPLLDRGSTSAITVSLLLVVGVTGPAGVVAASAASGITGAIKRYPALGMVSMTRGCLGS